MVSYIPLIVCLILPLVLVVSLKTSAAMLFVCISSATLLQEFIDKDAASAANSLLPAANIDYMSLFVLLVPIIIVTTAFKHTVSGPQLPLHVVIALTSGLTLLLVADRFLPESWLGGLYGTGIWNDILSFQTVIIGVGFMLSVLALYFGRTKHAHGKHHGKH